MSDLIGLLDHDILDVTSLYLSIYRPNFWALPSFLSAVFSLGLAILITIRKKDTRVPQTFVFLQFVILNLLEMTDIF